VLSHKLHLLYWPGQNLLSVSKNFNGNPIPIETRLYRLFYRIQEWARLCQSSLFLKEIVVRSLTVPILRIVLDED
jgi:hypothetical protein